jgi:acyl-coenzyme A thioesterase 13
MNGQLAGLILTLTDTIGSLALSTKGLRKTGVSVHIGTTFVKPGGVTGDVLRVQGRVTGLGEYLKSRYEWRCLR